MPRRGAPPRVSAAYPAGEVPIADIAAAPGNEAFAADYQRWRVAGQPADGFRLPTVEEMARTFEHGAAQLRAQRAADDPPLFFGGDPRRMEFIQAPANPDPSRYYRIVDSEEEAHQALDDGELPLVLPRSVHTMPTAAALDFINEVQQRMYEHPGAPFRNALELLRRGMPARGAESPIQPTIVPRYNVETEEFVQPIHRHLEERATTQPGPIPTPLQPLLDAVGATDEGRPASIAPSWPPRSTGAPASIAPAAGHAPVAMNAHLDGQTSRLIPIAQAWPLIAARGTT